MNVLLRRLIFFWLLAYSSGVHAAPSKPKTPIEHIIVLMFENRSFDHMLGYMKKENPNINGLTGKEFNLYDPQTPNSEKVYVHFDSPDEDPNAGHGYCEQVQQIYGTPYEEYCVAGSADPPPMSGFVASGETMEKGWGPQVLGCHNSSTTPVLAQLAREYVLFDEWFPSLPGPTENNRAFLQSCSSDGYTGNDPVILAEGFPQRTLFQNVAAAGYDWKVYFEFFPTSLFMRELRLHPTHFHEYSTFLKDAKDGNLPTYTFLEPRYFSIGPDYPANDQHPSHLVSEGEKLIKEVYEAVRSSPLWEKTALLITYDEHGGYYDHVPTPVNNVPSPDGKTPPRSEPRFNFDRLGIRVPAVLVSPWVKKGHVEHGPRGPTKSSRYEHSSVAATIKEMLDLPNFLNHRDEWAGTFHHLFENDVPRDDCPEKLVNPHEYKKKENEHLQSIHDLQRGMVHTASALHDHKYSYEHVQTERDAALYIKEMMNKFLHKE